MKPVTLFVQAPDGSLRSATADDVKGWLADDVERSRVVDESKVRAELSRWPDARLGWRRVFTGYAGFASNVRYLYGGDEVAPWVEGRLAVGSEPESWWIESWDPDRLGVRLPRRGPYPDLERACVAVETGRPALPWPPEPRLPNDPRVSDTMQCLEIAKQWRQLALRLHGALTPFREIAGIREVWNELWPLPGDAA